LTSKIRSDNKVYPIIGGGDVIRNDKSSVNDEPEMKREVEQSSFSQGQK
jgi:hypothetical protein